MMTTATNKDLQQLKDLITAGNATTQKQISDLDANMQKQITDLTLQMKENYAQSDKKIDTSFADLKGQINNAESKFEILN
jgi:hypothetical protein